MVALTVTVTSEGVGERGAVEVMLEVVWPSLGVGVVIS